MSAYRHRFGGYLLVFDAAGTPLCIGNAFPTGMVLNNGIEVRNKSARSTAHRHPARRFRPGNRENVATEVVITMLFFLGETMMMSSIPFVGSGTPSGRAINRRVEHHTLFRLATVGASSS